MWTSCSRHHVWCLQSCFPSMVIPLQLASQDKLSLLSVVLVIIFNYSNRKVTNIPRLALNLKSPYLGLLGCGITALHRHAWKDPTQIPTLFAAVYKMMMANTKTWSQKWMRKLGESTVKISFYHQKENIRLMNIEMRGRSGRVLSHGRRLLTCDLYWNPPKHSLMPETFVRCGPSSVPETRASIMHALCSHKTCILIREANPSKHRITAGHCDNCWKYTMEEAKVRRRDTQADKTKSRARICRNITYWLEVSHGHKPITEGMDWAIQEGRQWRPPTGYPAIPLWLSFHSALSSLLGYPAIRVTTNTLHSLALSSYTTPHGETQTWLASLLSGTDTTFPRKMRINEHSPQRECTAIQV